MSQHIFIKIKSKIIKFLFIFFLKDKGKFGLIEPKYKLNKHHFNVDSHLYNKRNNFFLCFIFS